LKFQPDTLAGVNMIHRHDPGRIVIGGNAYGHSLVVPWVGEVLRWDVDRFEALAADSLASGRYTAFFTAAPLHLRGGVGSPGNALAIR